MASKRVWIKYWMLTTSKAYAGPYFNRKARDAANLTLFGGMGKVKSYKALAERITSKEKENEKKQR